MVPISRLMLEPRFLEQPRSRGFAVIVEKKPGNKVECNVLKNELLSSSHLNSG